MSVVNIELVENSYNTLGPFLYIQSIFCVDLNLNNWMAYKISRISISFWSVKCQGSFEIFSFLFHESTRIIVNWKYYHVQYRLAIIFHEWKSALFGKFLLFFFLQRSGTKMLISIQSIHQTNQEISKNIFIIDEYC